MDDLVSRCRPRFGWRIHWPALEHACHRARRLRNIQARELANRCSLPNSPKARQPRLSRWRHARKPGVGTALHDVKSRPTRQVLLQLLRIFADYLAEGRLLLLLEQGLPSTSCLKAGAARGCKWNASKRNRHREASLRPAHRPIYGKAYAKETPTCPHHQLRQTEPE